MKLESICPVKDASCKKVKVCARCLSQFEDMKYMCPQQLPCKEQSQIKNFHVAKMSVLFHYLQSGQLGFPNLRKHAVPLKVILLK